MPCCFAKVSTSRQLKQCIYGASERRTVRMILSSLEVRSAQVAACAGTRVTLKEIILASSQAHLRTFSALPDGATTMEAAEQRSTR